MSPLQGKVGYGDDVASSVSGAEKPWVTRSSSRPKRDFGATVKSENSNDTFISDGSITLCYDNVIVAQ